MRSLSSPRRDSRAGASKTLLEFIGAILERFEISKQFVDVFHGVSLSCAIIEKRGDMPIDFGENFGQIHVSIDDGIRLVKGFLDIALTAQSGASFRLGTVSARHQAAHLGFA